MPTPVPSQAEMRKLIDEADQKFHAVVSKRESLGLLEGAQLGMYALQTFARVIPYIRSLEETNTLLRKEHGELRQAMEKAEYEGAMARGEFRSLCLDAGMTRLNNSLNVLKDTRLSIPYRS